MKSNQFWAAVSKALAVMTVTLIMALMLAPGAWAASTYKILHAFRRSSGGQGPSGNLISDAAGNLYGTTYVGGAGGAGVVFKLAPNPDGTWTEHVLHRFTGGADGVNPSAGVILDAAGNLYGTTGGGGSSSCGCGVVFKLMPNPDRTWTEHLLHSFTGADGAYPNGVILDAAGNLYGTTFVGGAGGAGVVFKLAPNPDGTWTEHVLHSFTGGADVEGPVAGVILDAAGNLYGTTVSGGSSSCGVSGGCGFVFKLTHKSNGTWTEHVLHTFTNGADGGVPFAGVILDAAGNLYGTTTYGLGSGNVFKLAPNPDGTWTEHVLHTFTGGADGGVPEAAVILDAAGNLYGTTNSGGLGAGVVFKLTHKSDGTWTEHVLHAFLGYGNGPDGLLRGASGNLYGTTYGGTSGGGLVFEIKP